MPSESLVPRGVLWVLSLLPIAGCLDWTIDELAGGGECDPVEQTCCDGGQECIIGPTSPHDEVCVSPLRGGSGVDGDLCPDGDRSCALGYACT